MWITKKYIQQWACPQDFDIFQRQNSFLVCESVHLILIVHDKINKTFLDILDMFSLNQTLFLHKSFEVHSLTHLSVTHCLQEEINYRRTKCIPEGLVFVSVAEPRQL